MSKSKLPEELKLLNEWQSRLGLQDWFITLIYPCQDEDMIEVADGDVEYVESTKSANIRIISPKIRKNCIKPFDFEQVLVHELLHCKFALLSNGEDWGEDLTLRILHQLIDTLATALVDAKRNGCKNETKSIQKSK